MLPPEERRYNSGPPPFIFAINDLLLNFPCTLYYCNWRRWRHFLWI